MLTFTLNPACRKFIDDQLNGRSDSFKTYPAKPHLLGVYPYGIREAYQTHSDTLCKIAQAYSQLDPKWQVILCASHVETLCRLGCSFDADTLTVSFDADGIVDAMEDAAAK